MSVVTSPSDFRPSPVSGSAEITFVKRDGATRLSHLYHHDPLRVLFPRPENAAQPVAVLATTSGGLVGGDRMAVTARVGEGASAFFTTQSAEKIYRSAGPDCRVEIGLKVEPDGWMEWLPHETILFEGARLRRRTEADVARGGELMAAEAIVLGRTARGEKMTRGLARDAWEIRRNGRLVWADALHLDGDIAGLTAAPAGFDGAVALATFVFVADSAPDCLDLARALLPENDDSQMKAAATSVNGVLVVRWIARDAMALRSSLGAFWTAFRRRARNRAGEIPRIWSM